MSKTAFDPQLFAQTAIKAQLDTQIIPCPVGDYRFIISKIDFRQAGRKENPNDKLTFLDMTCDLDIGLYPEVVEETKRDKISIRYSIILDLNEAGMLDTEPGRNVSLGRLREVLGQNTDEEWTFNMLVGQPIVGKVVHEPYKDSIIANISTVSAVE